MTAATLEFSKFSANDFPEYRSWYEDTELNARLGPPVDQEWLDAVLGETDGCTYSVFEAGELVAVVGIVYPDEEHPTYVITDIAVKPERRGTGVGARVVRALIDMTKRAPEQYWVAFVNDDNHRAKTFFERLGWCCVSGPPKNNDMYKLVWGAQGTRPRRCRVDP